MKEKDVFILEILVVILLSLGFERFKTWLDNKFHSMGTRGKKMILMKESLFSEIMTLGFIGLLVFISTKSGEAHYLGKQLFLGDEEMLEEEEPLSETFEIVHMIIFCIMVTFVLQCSILMLRASNESNKWEMWENLRVKGDAQVKDDANAPLDTRLIENGYLRRTDKGNYVSAKPFVYTNNWFRVLQSSSGLRELIEWRAVRHEFLFPSVNVTSGRHDMNGTPSIPDGDNSRGELESWGKMRNHVRIVESPQYFSFHQYLEQGLGDIFVELVEVDMKTWVVAAFFCPFLHITMEMDAVHLHTLITVMSWTWVLLTFLFGIHVYNVYHEVTPELPTDPKAILEVFTGTSTHALKSKGRRASQIQMGRTKSKSSVDSGNAGISSPDLSPKAAGDYSPPNLGASHPSTDSLLGVEAEPTLSEPLLKKLDENLRNQESRLHEATVNGCCGLESDVEMQKPIFSPSSAGETINSPFGSDIDINASEFQLIKRIPARFRLKEVKALSRPWYLRIMIGCGCLDKTTVPNYQQRLFLFHEWSKEFYSFFLEVIMFFQAITTSMYLVIWFSSHEKWTPAQWVCFVAGVIAPFFNLICLVPRIVSKMCIIMMIEYHKDEEMIQSVIFSCKKQQLLESLKLLKIAKLKGRMSRLSDKNGKLTAKIFEGTKERFNHLSVKKQKDISKVFHLFDSDSSGTISKDEMILILNSMNMDQNSEAGEHAMELMNLVDFDNSGSLQEDEFKVLMCLALYHSGPEEERLDLEKLFQEFDEDKSGKVSVRELSNYFAGLGVSLNEDDMAELVFSIFKSSKQQLDLQHFMYFLHKLEETADKT